MQGKFSWAFFALLAVSAARTVSLQDVEDLETLAEKNNRIELRILENKILEAINALKEFLKKGAPEKGLPPLDPYFLSYQDFDFIIRDTELKGFLQNTTFANFSRFEPVNVELKLLPISLSYFKLEVFLDQLHIDGRYGVLGKFFNEVPVNGTGKFTSETKNLTVLLNIKPRLVNSSLQIKDLVFEYKILSEKINYTNELVSGQMCELDEKLALYILDKIQEKYMPPLLNMVKSVLNHFLLGFSFSEIIQIILDFLNKFKSLT